MCEVCAVFGIGNHWTDAAARANSRLPAPDIAKYRGERRLRIALINAIVASAGVELADWDGEAFWITEQSGRGERVPDLNAVWSAVQRVSGQRFDPLEDNFLPRNET